MSTYDILKSAIEEDRLVDVVNILGQIPPNNK